MVKMLHHRKKNKCVRALATLPRSTPTFGTSQHAQEESHGFYNTISYFAKIGFVVQSQFAAALDGSLANTGRSPSPEKSTLRYA
jgi:hypothetical protein